MRVWMVWKLVSGAAQPTLVDVVLPGADGLLTDGVLGLLLGADHEDALAALGHFGREGARLLQQAHGLLEVYDVDAVANCEDEPAHPRVPPMRLMTEMDSGLQ